MSHLHCIRHYKLPKGYIYILFEHCRVWFPKEYWNQPLVACNLSKDEQLGDKHSQ